MPAFAPRAIPQLVRDTFREFAEDKAPRLSAALAYYTVFSLAPLLVIAIAIAGLAFGAEAAQAAIVAQVGGLVGERGAEGVTALMEAANRPREGAVATAVGVVTLLLGASGVFGQLQDAMNTIWEVRPRKLGFLHTVRTRFFSMTMVLGVGFLLLVSLAVSAGLAAAGEFMAARLPGGELLWHVVNFVVSLAVVTALFALLFKLLPDVVMAWRDVWMGAGITAVLFTVGKLLIGLYLGKSAWTSAYGAVGALVVVLLWVYYSAMIFFLGAEFTQVYANRYGSRVRPDEDAEPVTEEERAQEGLPRDDREDRPRPARGRGRPGA